MPRESKETAILELFLDYPTKHWHFGAIKLKVPIADSKISRWLKKFCKKGMIKRVKELGKMPYYIARFLSPEYINTKKIIGLQKLNESGLLNHLCSIEKVKTAILFGSFYHGDWHKDSDIDIFVFGDLNKGDLNIGKYERKLQHEIQTFTCKNLQELRKFDGKLIESIIKGIILKGNIDFLKVKINVKIPDRKRDIQ